MFRFKNEGNEGEATDIKLNSHYKGSDINLLLVLCSLVMRQRAWDDHNNNPGRKTFRNGLHVLISRSGNFSAFFSCTKGSRRVYNDNEGSMKNFSQNLIIDMCVKWRCGMLREE